jgi:hypothetical protein
MDYPHQSLVGSVVINAEFYKESQFNFPQLRSRESLNHLIPELAPEPN